jgi:3-hydroxyacyl-CoA dehydrogenase
MRWSGGEQLPKGKTTKEEMTAEEMLRQMIEEIKEGTKMLKEFAKTRKQAEKEAEKQHQEINAQISVFETLIPELYQAHQRHHLVIQKITGKVADDSTS